MKVSRSNLGWIAGFFAIGTFLMVAYVLYQMLHPADLGRFNHLELDAPNGEVKAGSLVFYEAKDCDPANFKADVFRTLVTNTVPPEVTLAAGSRFDDHLLCRNVVLIPAEAPTGEYRLSITVDYHVNPFQDRNVTYVSKVFRVVNDDEQFNILKDAIRNETELQEGEPQSPPTRSPQSQTESMPEEIATKPRSTSPLTPSPEKEPQTREVCTIDTTAILLPIKPNCRQEPV